MSTDEIGFVAKDLPRDIIVEILSKVPVRSILRFKSVCKSWYALLTNPNFTSRHFINQSISNNSNDTCFLFTRHHSTTNHTSVNGSGSITFLSNDKSLDVPISLDIPFLTISKPLRVSGSCNGLVCLSILPLGSIILLWNPATREFKDLPISHIDRPKTGPIKVVLGFGFDAGSNDYKVLRVVYYCYPLNQVEVYSLSTNSWKEIKTTVQFLIFESSSSVFLERRFHWTAIGFGDMNGRKLIVSFDMGDEVFRYIMPPNFGFIGNDADADADDNGDDDSDDGKVRWSVMVLKGSLAVIGSGGNGPDKKFDIWFMNEYGVTGSWTKYKSFGLYTRIDRPLGCGGNGEVLLEKDHSELVLYDTNTQSIKNIGDRGVACWSDVFIHVDSLLPIRGGKFAEETCLSAVVPDYFFVRKFDLVLD